MTHYEAEILPNIKDDEGHFPASVLVQINNKLQPSLKNWQFCIYRFKQQSFCPSGFIFVIIDHTLH